jgi:DNA-binding CsgD family transcriptional regulator
MLKYFVHMAHCQLRVGSLREEGCKRRTLNALWLHSARSCRTWVQLSQEERNALEALVRRHGTPQQLAKRGRMILGAAEGKRNAEIARELGVSTDRVRKWHMHWIGLQAIALSDLSVSERLADLPRLGQPSQITAEQTCRLLALGCSQPKERPISRLPGAGNCRGNDGPRHHRTHFTPARGSSLKKGALQPHLIRYWLTPPEDPHREATKEGVSM